MVDQQEYGATKDSNGLNPFVHKSRCTLCDFIENWGYILLNYLQVSPLEMCTMTPFTSLYEWCHVMCSVVFKDINNLYNIRMVGKFQIFIYDKCHSSSTIKFIWSMQKGSSTLDKICIFTVVEHAKVWIISIFLVS